MGTDYPVPTLLQVMTFEFTYDIVDAETGEVLTKSNKAYITKDSPSFELSLDRVFRSFLRGLSLNRSLSLCLTCIKVNPQPTLFDLYPEIDNCPF